MINKNRLIRLKTNNDEIDCRTKLNQISKVCVCLMKKKTNIIRSQNHHHSCIYVCDEY